jgi:hypothetical protein
MSTVKVTDEIAWVIAARLGLIGEGKCILFRLDLDRMGTLIGSIMLSFTWNTWFSLLRSYHRPLLTAMHRTSRNDVNHLPHSHISTASSSSASLKKAASRAGTTLMQKTGQIERTVDREFAEEEGRYRT